MHYHWFKCPKNWLIKTALNNNGVCHITSIYSLLGYKSLWHIWLCCWPHDNTVVFGLDLLGETPKWVRHMVLHFVSICGRNCGSSIKMHCCWQLLIYVNPCFHTDRAKSLCCNCSLQICGSLLVQYLLDVFHASHLFAGMQQGIKQVFVPATFISWNNKNTLIKILPCLSWLLDFGVCGSPHSFGPGLEL